MSDSDDEEKTFFYGTPLQPIDEDEAPSKRKYQREKADSYALDEHGRRRFHGAFTGGFSAGFGNTVSTPEGFTPATFKSSRSEKASVSNQRPQDFMDDEDLDELGIGPKSLQARDEYGGQRKTAQKRYHDGVIPGAPILEDMLEVVQDTAAVRLLKAMGWRPGQGTGHRLTAGQKKRAAHRQKVYGCYMPPDLMQNSQEKEPPSSDSDDDATLFAPDDYAPFILKDKKDKFGLGYSGLSRHSVLGNLDTEFGSSASTSHLVMRDKGKKVSIRGQAFGVGALEDDDDDIYAKDDMSNYDFVLGGPSRPDKRVKEKRNAGVNVLPGFVPSPAPLAPLPRYPPPPLPRGYSPATVRSRFDSTRVPVRNIGDSKFELTPEARGALLGEEPLPKPTEPPPQPTPKEPQNDELIAKLLGRNVNFVSVDSAPQSKGADFIPLNVNDEAPKKQFKPFVGDPLKQARYEKYLKERESSAADKDGAIGRIAEWERDRETREFEQAAKLYKPLTGVMGDRFTHAQEQDDQPTNALCSVARSKLNRGLATQDMIDAAAKGLFGTLTRKSEEWRPDSLVCKRFNVPDPFCAKPKTSKDEKQKVSYSIFEYMESSIHNKDTFAKEQGKFSGYKSLATSTDSRTSFSNVSNVQSKDLDKQTVAVEKIDLTRQNVDTIAAVPIQEVAEPTNKRMTVLDLFIEEYKRDEAKKQETEVVTETIEKFDKMELYKSIFLSDSEEEEAEKITEDEDLVEKPKNIERNLSPPRGIFANIDFDELNSWKHTETEQESKDDEQKTEEIKDVIEENDLYGPKLPEAIKQKLVEDSDKERDSFKPEFRRKSERDKPIEIDSSSSADSWVEADKVGSKKTKKKKSKKKKSKHKKSKHKRKH